MRIAVLSGKGGAGKTFVAVNLASAAGQGVYIDCDVEEPNGRLFFKPQQLRQSPVTTLLPQFDAQKCTGCRKCVKFCHFNALIYIKEKPMVFTEVCHSCGGCVLTCPEKAITETSRDVGRIEYGKHGNIRVVTGVLNPGEASGIPVIRSALKQSDPLTIVDCPPGSACSVMESVMDADFCLLVAEPTAFGFHNFQMVYELAQLLGKKCGVVINKMDAAYAPLETFCKENHLPILARIPYSAQTAMQVSRGEIVSESDPVLADLFRDILSQIRGAVQ